jgi:hypothetical protein
MLDDRGRTVSGGRRHVGLVVVVVVTAVVKLVAYRSENPDLPPMGNGFLRNALPDPSAPF